MHSVLARIATSRSFWSVQPTKKAIHTESYLPLRALSTSLVLPASHTHTHATVLQSTAPRCPSLFPPLLNPPSFCRPVVARLRMGSWWPGLRVGADWGCGGGAAAVADGCLMGPRGSAAGDAARCGCLSPEFSTSRSALLEHSRTCVRSPS